MREDRERKSPGYQDRQGLGALADHEQHHPDDRTDDQQGRDADRDRVGSDPVPTQLGA